MNIPLLNLKKTHAEIRAELLAAMERVLDATVYIGGVELATFEREFAAWVGPDCSVVGCANGSDAITLAALALELPPGSEAIVPAMTYPATVSALLNAGLRVRLVDIDATTWLIDLAQVEHALTDQTRLLVPVHLYGQMAPMDEVRRIADAAKARILEDAAQAQGALWKGKGPGFWGDIATYSFYPGKNLGALGDAGAILSHSPKLVERCRALGNQGGIRKYEHDYIGYNSRLDPLQAALLRAKLSHLNRWNEARRRVASSYFEALREIAGFILPRERANAVHVYHQFVVQVEGDRERFVAHLKEKGIETGSHYPNPIHRIPAFRNLSFAKERFPEAERLAERGVSLPMCPTLTEEQVSYVVETVRGYFGMVR